MHRRSRHLNPKAAGALIALDARFLSLSGGASVSTWTNRTGSNDLTQATAANQPTFQTAVQGGCPVVRFDGSNDSVSVGNSLNFTNELTFIAVLKSSTSGNFTIFAKEGDDVEFGLWGTSGTVLAQSGIKFLVTEGTSSPTTWQIATTNWNGVSTAAVYRNSLQLNQLTNISVTLINRTTSQVGRNNTSGFFNGDMGIVTCIPIYLSNALRKRLEQAGAMAYKIACN